MANKIRKTFTKITKIRAKSSENEQMLKLDETDKNLIRTLVRNARLSYREIARQNSLAVKTVIDRIRRLEAAGVITSYSADLDSKKLGYGVVAVIELVAPKGLIKRMATELAKQPNIFIVYEVTGGTDTLIIAKFRDTDELEAFLRSFQGKEFVQSTQTKIVLKSIKEDFRMSV